MEGEHVTLNAITSIATVTYECTIIETCTDMNCIMVLTYID